MDYLYNLNLNESEILKMIDVNNHIKDMSDLEMITYIYILVDIGCSQAQLLAIITSNPNYFSRSVEDIRKILERLLSLEEIDIPSILVNNPNILSIDVSLIEDYFKENGNLNLSDKELLEKFIKDCF